MKFSCLHTGSLAYTRFSPYKGSKRKDKSLKNKEGCFVNMDGQTMDQHESLACDSKTSSCKENFKYFVEYEFPSRRKTCVVHIRDNMMQMKSSN